MKNFSDYKNELNKCSQCGLCMAVCPVYQKTKNDCANARGLCTMLNGVIEQKLEFDETILKYLKMCLDNKNCEKCKSFCPSGIDLQTIFDSAYQFEKCNKKLQTSKSSQLMA